MKLPNARAPAVDLVTEEAGRRAAREERREGDEGPIFHGVLAHLVGRAVFSAASAYRSKNGLQALRHGPFAKSLRLAQAARRRCHGFVETPGRPPVPTFDLWGTESRGVSTRMSN